MSDQAPESTILIVDDDIVNLKLAVECLDDLGVKLLTARDGRTAIERAHIAQPDLILLDVQMPGIDGFETCRQLKAAPSTQAIPVIFMTALNSIDDKLRGFEVGGVDYIPKPVQLAELHARVKTHLALYQLQKALQSEIHERKQAEAALFKANQELQRLAVLDGLTQVANRRRFDQYLHNRWREATAQPLSIILCDIDFFKRYNDTYGHVAGDLCIQQIARSISRAVSREQALVARYGGEEFAVVLPATTLSEARTVAEAIQREVAALRLAHAASAASSVVTLSLGIACLHPSPQQEPSSLVAAADAALYRAKEHGRNRIEVEQAAP